MNAAQQSITHEDIQQALAAFRRRGGTITRLPDQVQPAAAPVGARWQAWEVDLAALGLAEDNAPAALRVLEASPAGAA